MEIVIKTLDDARDHISKILDRLRLLDADKKSDSEEPIETTIAAFYQFLDIAAGVEDRKQEFASNDISDIGEHGLTILEKLIYKTAAPEYTIEKGILTQIVLLVTDWIIQRDGIINLLEPIVDALAQVANSITEQQQLIALVDFMSEIIDACSDSIKQDMEMSNMQRPWRVLHINRGIVATRSNDPTTMRRIFAELITALPMDAPNFFKEGMSEMVRLNYPEQVREVMQEFFDKTDKPQIH